MSGPTAVPVLPESVPGAPALDAVRREFRRSRRSSGEAWRAARLREQLPRVVLHEALEILLGWTDDPRRFDAGAVAWHSRLAGNAPRLSLAESEQALTALHELPGPHPEEAARTLRALSRRHRLDDVAAALDDWLARRRAV